MVRRINDAYYTPTHAVQTLLRHVELVGDIFEPCNGDGAISNVLEAHDEYLNVTYSDITMGEQFDATKSYLWSFPSNIDWTVTNPPFNVAHQIIPLAYEHSRLGIVMLLRLSYLEPCKNRQYFLEQFPPTKLIVLPRISFTGNGKTDSCTCAWFIWEKMLERTSSITITGRQQGE